MSVAVVPPAKEGARSASPRLERVLVATDFSELGNRAIGYGNALVERDGTLKLIYVASPGDSTETRDQLLAQLDALAPPDASGGLQVEREIVEGTDPAATITEEAERFGADAICLGSHGRTGLTKTLLGSVAQAVMAKSKAPDFRRPG